MKSNVLMAAIVARREFHLLGLRKIFRDHRA
jgi:hypothetical protein